MMKACLHLSNGKYVEIHELKKVLKDVPSGTKTIELEEVKNTVYSNASYTFIGNQTVAIASAHIEFIQFID